MISIYSLSSAGHYKAVAQEYDFFYDHMYEEQAELSCKWLKLLPTDSLADIGGGTGAVSSLIWKKARKLQDSKITEVSSCFMTFRLVLFCRS